MRYLRFLRMIQWLETCTYIVICKSGDHDKNSVVLQQLRNEACQRYKC